MLGERGYSREVGRAMLSISRDLAQAAAKDDKPNMITILHGYHLEALGIRTVWEALGLVPGLQIRVNQTQSPGAIGRGVEAAFNSGNIKVQVNSVAARQEFSGVAVAALYLPIELVDRIEVVRGPGSSIYGNAAFSGLINVITREETHPLALELRITPKVTVTRGCCLPRRVGRSLTAKGLGKK